MDKLTRAQRSNLMSRVRQRNTGPELVVRKLLHRLGYRFRLHRKDLPGSPDIVLPGRGAVVLVHGCFWHGHTCRAGSMPKSRIDYWGPKITANRDRDKRQSRRLRALGWRVLTVWECELKDPHKLERKFIRFLS
ncbi:very short patch repair endonuclease [Luteimonas salinilitoris]|uniref:Very short patch repair endonuclease n=1 Tax=Luteimonas salinilitoris TaxID=3237697 RepID=A0ABV4HPF8_9GAMM